MDGLFYLIVGVAILIKFIGKYAEWMVNRAAGQTIKQDAPPAHIGGMPPQAVSAQKRDQMAQEEKWHDAKQRQDDAKQVHSIHVDSCENRLKNLRVLYDAGILDHEEYAQRVARVKAKHNEAK